MAQGMQQPQGQMISGQYVAPSFAQQLNPLANILAGQAVGQKADTEQTDLARKLRELGGQEVQDILETYKKDPNLALQKASTARTPQARALAAQLSKATILEPTTLEREHKAAVAQGFKGSVNDFKNQLTESQKASILNDQEGRRIDRARLNLTAQEQSFNTGMPMGGVSAPQGMPPAPLRTISPGSPILAPGQQIMPQAGQPQIAPQQNMPQQAPRFNSKAEQDIYVATQKEKGKLQAEAQNALPGALLTAQTGIDTIKELIGDTKVDAKGNIVYGKQRPKAGFEASVGMPSFGSGLGIANLFPGSEAADFKAAFEQTSGQAFLGAISTLKGSGAISEVEGAKATAALNRMKLSQSEVEFIRAANDFKDVLEKGYKAAQQRAGGAPINLNAQPGATKRLVYNPQTGTLE
jgi:hypothetical protein